MSVNLPAELGIERDRSFQQERRDRLVLEATRADECFVDGLQIVPVLIESGADTVEIAERRKELQRARQQAFTLKQLEQPPGTGSEGLCRPMASRPRRRRSALPRTPRA